MADAQQALLDLIKYCAPMLCEVCSANGESVLIEAKLGDLNGKPAAVWEHSSDPRVEPHWRRIVPLPETKP